MGMDTDSRLGFSYPVSDTDAQGPVKEPEDTAPAGVAEHPFFRSRMTLYHPQVQQRAERVPPWSHGLVESGNGQGSL